jgi:putative transposase
MFLRDGDRLFFHRCLTELAREAGVRVHAYVLMSNHVHLLASGDGPNALPSLFVRLGRRYVRYFNDVHGRTGSLWEGRYRASLVQHERYFFVCHRYIEQNPVRAGIVQRPGDFAWSSHRHHAQGVPDDLVSPHELISSLGEDPQARRSAYRELLEEMLSDEELGEVRDSIQGGWVLGSPRFCDEVTRRAQRRAKPLRAGRRSRNESPVQFEPGSHQLPIQLEPGSN